MNIRTMVADDDAGMRLLLKKIVEKTPGFEAPVEAKDGLEALDLFERYRPRLVFLDIEMPLQSGVECARRIQDIDPRAFIVFVTAHEEYMREAFELYAMDYLVKPFKVARVQETLERMRQIEAGKYLRSVDSAASISAGTRLVIKRKESVQVVDTAEIILIQREERQSAIYTVGGRVLSGDTLSELERQLPPDRFFRSHKSYIINVGAVQGIYPYGRWTYIVKLRGLQQDALLTFERYPELMRRIGG